MDDITAIDAVENIGKSTVIPVFNPSTEEQIGEVQDSDKAAVDRAVARARESYESGVWRNLPAAKRAEVLWRAAEIIKQRADEIVDLESRDNGMSRTHARNLVLGSTEILHYYGGWCTKIHGMAVDIVADGGITGTFQQYHGYTRWSRSASSASSFPGTDLSIAP